MNCTCLKLTGSCTCNNCQKSSSDNVTYIGPDLSCTGIDINDNLTTVIQKIDFATCLLLPSPRGFLRTEDGLPLTDIAKYVVDNSGIQSTLKLSTSTITIVPVVNTTGFIVDMPRIGPGLPGGIPDAIRSTVRGHDYAPGIPGALTAAFYATIYSRRSVGFDSAGSVSPEFPELTESIGFRANFPSNSIGNLAFVGRKGGVVQFQVDDAGILTANKLITLTANVTPPVATGGLVVDMPHNSTMPPINTGVADSITSRIRGHNGASESYVSAFYGVISGNRNMGLDIVSSTNFAPVTNSIGVRVSLPETSTGNIAFQARRTSATLPAVIQFQVDDSGRVKANQFSLINLNTAPLNSGDTGTLGEIRITADSIYVCIAANTWRKVALAIF